MLNLIGEMAGMLAIAVNLVAFTGALAVTRTQRLAVTAIAGAWIGLASGLGAAGRLAFSPESPVPLIGVLVATPLLVVGALALLHRGFRASLIALPTSLLVGLHSLRVLGVLFLLLAAAGRLSGPFPYAAGLGDMLTGFIAIGLALRIARAGGEPVRGIAAWNLFGVLDLVAAVGLGLTSANGSPLQLIHAGVGSQAMQYLPYALVPAVLVPFYLITHGIIAAQLRVHRSATQGRTAGPLASGQATARAAL